MAADAHLVLPAFFGLALADGAVDEPTEFAGLKLPGRTMIAAAGRAFFHDPAGSWFFLVDSHSGQEKEYLPFDVGGDGAPALFVTMDGFDGDPQEFGQLLLGLG